MAKKLFYSMGEVAEMFDVNQSLIRHWESKFDILKPKKNKKGNRMFTPSDVENLKVIYHLVKEQGMTLEGAAQSIKRMAKVGAGAMNRDVELMERLQSVRALLLEVRAELKMSDDEILTDDGLSDEIVSQTEPRFSEAAIRAKSVFDGMQTAPEVTQTEQESATEAEAEVETKANVEARADEEVAVETEAESEVAVDTETETETEVAVDTEPETETETDIEIEPEEESMEIVSEEANSDEEVSDETTLDEEVSEEATSENQNSEFVPTQEQPQEAEEEKEEEEETKTNDEGETGGDTNGETGGDESSKSPKRRGRPKSTEGAQTEVLKIRKPRSKKKKEEDKELFAFYEQSLF